MGGWTKLLIASPVILVIALSVGVSASRSQDDPNRGNNESEATTRCEEAIERRLTAPATAEFETTAYGGGPWTVQGTVDSENSFGALVRLDFGCTVTIVDGLAKTEVTLLE